jgi:ribosomal protein L7Ae-like RNA K-turn-binding protein
MVRSSFYHH